jgi:N utilization substance protein A
MAMRSQFLLAFNEICREKQLPSETVFEALKAALVSAYRRNTNVSNSQQVTADIDSRTGELTIYAEKEVVDSTIDDRTEVTLEDARRAQPDAELGDMVMVDSTPAQFGRIAAQTAKQVILQRVREAERDHLYDEFSQREGEIINGTVQSVSGGNITIGLGRTEAILPRVHQVRGERYRAHDKIRVFVLEVKKGNRGPMIYVSRSHRSLLRRLLELEVPEIYNGHVEIKSIAREAGQRSKVAVQALQPGVDPVGACVGMRGVRIQSIVRELNDEKIDVIEWDPDYKSFIAKALSPARVTHVFLDDDPTGTRTASVIVPDDQLSLAIGREGQNARLAAKLTGWRIDIKSLTEAASESMNNLDNPAVSPALINDLRLIEQVRSVLEKKEANRPITAEDYSYLSRLIVGVEGAIIAEKQRGYEAIRDQHKLARRRVPKAYWDLELEEINLPLRIHNALMEADVQNVGEVVFRLGIGDRALLGIDAIDGDALATIKVRLANFIEEWEAMAAQTTAEDATADEAEDVADEVQEAAPVAEAVDEDVSFVDAVAAEEEVFVEVDEPVGAVTVEQPLIEEVAAVVGSEEETGAVVDEETVLPADILDIVDDLSKPLVEIPEKEEKDEQPVMPTVRIVRSSQDDDDDEDESGDRRRKGKELVFDEKAGRVVSKRKRKQSRRRPDWEDMGDEFDF